jgi:hypothetical protein
MPFAVEPVVRELFQNLHAGLIPFNVACAGRH